MLQRVYHSLIISTLKNLSLLPLTSFQKSYSGQLCIEREMPTEVPPVTVEKEDKRLKWTHRRLVCKQAVSEAWWWAGHATLLRALLTMRISAPRSYQGLCLCDFLLFFPFWLWQALFYLKSSSYTHWRSQILKLCSFSHDDTISEINWWSQKLMYHLHREIIVLRVT